ncbi:LysR family transcriptional regulator [Pseudomonas capeferrum]|uniref:LysR family transcriptional regulator n=1 Tax=Pseudomonas capeferrum TaxID=1495066 RepID=UPI0015E345AA|nr:LysR family transcriptional regulator [Pseudomonas capeferrum]MBA1203284.1 LysR family transcriptional regulator [Pseudomonas capeferrum]
MFDWEDLRHFCAFVREGSLSAAARTLGVDHATVGRRISSLEASLDLKLIDRRPRAFVLTEEGLRVGEMAEQMNASSFALERYADSGQQRVEGEVVLSAPPAFLGSLIARHIGALYKRHPQLRLTLVGTKARASLARREADITIGLTRPTEPTLVTSLLGRLDFSLYASPDFLRSGAAQVFIGYDKTQSRSPQQRWLLNHAQGRDFVLHSNDLRIQALAAAGGAGIVCLPAFMAEEYGLEPVAMDTEALSLDIWLTVHEDVRDTPRIKAVTEFITQRVAPIYRM